MQIRSFEKAVLEIFFKEK